MIVFVTVSLCDRPLVSVIVFVTEFSGAWGKRGEGGQGREGVQLPDSLMNEAVLQSAGPGLETPQSPP